MPHPLVIIFLGKWGCYSLVPWFLVPTSITISVYNVEHMWLDHLQQKFSSYHIN